MNQLLWKDVWRGFAPPKVEILCWQILRGRVAVKGNLAARGLMNWNDASCPFCKGQGLAWFNTAPKPICGKVWDLVFFVTVWTLWLTRNDVIFNNKNVELLQVIDTAKLRLSHWIKAKWPQFHEGWMKIMRCPNLVFNVDGSAIGNPGAAGIRGILRDHLGRKRLEFSKSIGVGDSNLAELLAKIKEAFVLFLASPWASNCALVIESDSTNAVKWVNHPQTAPWRLRKWVVHIENLKLQPIEWKVVHILRERNGIADGLAKAGVSRASDFVEIVE
ncbi:hypothetical protein PTKIN_Ptkin01aG0319200 [Pterospermum kingtungense]